MDLMITREQLAGWSICTAPKVSRTAKLIPPGGLYLRDALRSTDVPEADLIWLATREGLLPDRELRLFACRCARRALELVADSDPCSIAAVETAERFARGEATANELAAAQAAAAATRAEDAAAWAAMWAATQAARQAATRAAWNAALWAAWAAAGAEWDTADATAERATQIADLLDVINRLEAPCEP